MVAPAIGQVVLVPLPFSDLTKAKLRPAVVLADAGQDDWVLCQVTSNPCSDPHAIQLVETSFQSGSLQVTSYARPGKLFTANSSLMLSQVGHLKIERVRDIVEAVVSLLRMGIEA
jgi:mRNA interferase MazF